MLDYCLLNSCLCSHAGKKQDVWFVVDPETGEKQTSLTTSASESICPNSPLLYIGRTGVSPGQQHGSSGFELDAFELMLFVFQST